MRHYISLVEALNRISTSFRGPLLAALDDAQTGINDQSPLSVSHALKMFNDYAQHVNVRRRDGVKGNLRAYISINVAAIERAVEAQDFALAQTELDQLVDLVRVNVV